MKILIIYATYSGGTQITAELLSKLLSDTHEVTLKTPDQVEASDLDGAKAVLFGTPSWMQDGVDGQPHEYYFDFMEKFKDYSFGGKKVAVFGLGDRDYARFTHGVDVLQEFIKKHGGTLVTEPLRIDSFHFKQEESEQLIKDWATSLLSAL